MIAAAMDTLVDGPYWVLEFDTALLLVLTCAAATPTPTEALIVLLNTNVGPTVAVKAGPIVVLDAEEVMVPGGTPGELQV